MATTVTLPLLLKMEEATTSNKAINMAVCSHPQVKGESRLEYSGLEVRDCGMVAGCMVEVNASLLGDAPEVANQN
jgi:hypothetical protein